MIFALFPAVILNALGRPPNVGEVKFSFYDIAGGKSPAFDGIVSEFYWKFWDLIRTNFVAMLKNATVTGVLVQEMKDGLIVLLPNDYDLELMTNWRPFTLLNISYKIMAKVLQIRLQSLLLDVIH